MVEIALHSGITSIGGQALTHNYAASIDTYAKAKQFVAALTAESKDKIPDEAMDRMEDIVFYVQGQQRLKVAEIHEPATFRVTIKKDFLAEAAAGIGVPGCFNPTGIHREMFLIHAAEVNAGVIQVFTESGVQVANAVIIYTAEGVYVEPLHSSSFYDLDEVFGAALAQLVQSVPRLVLRKTSAGHKYLATFGKPSTESVKVTKPAVLFKDQYFDAGEVGEDGSLSLKIDNLLIVTRQDVSEHVIIPALAGEQAVKVDIDFTVLGQTFTGDSALISYLFLVGALKRKIVQEGRTIIDDGFYQWVEQEIMANPRTAALNPAPEEIDRIADILIDYLEAQQWPLQIDTPPRANKKHIEQMEQKIGKKGEDAAASPIADTPLAGSASAVNNKIIDQNLGGIKMDSKALDLQTSGKGEDFNLPSDPAEWQNIKFDGFAPVILQIIPANLPLLLGVKPSPKAEQVSLLESGAH